MPISTKDKYRDAPRRPRKLPLRLPLSDKTRRAIRVSVLDLEVSQTQAAKQFGVSRHTVREVVKDSPGSEYETRQAARCPECRVSSTVFRKDGQRCLACDVRNKAAVPE